VTGRALRSSGCTTTPALPSASEFGGTSEPVPYWFGRSTILMALADGWYARQLQDVLDCPSQPTTERDQGSPIGKLQRNLASRLVDGGEGVGLVWSLNNLYATHNRQETRKPQDGFPGKSTVHAPPRFPLTNALLSARQMPASRTFRSPDADPGRETRRDGFTRPRLI
jgi:hypothetical protein